MMMRVFTVRFSGIGRVDCRRCSHATVFPDSVKAIITDDGFSTQVLDAEYLTILHRCGREFRWTCEECGTVRESKGPIPNIRTGMSRKTVYRHHPVLRCTWCGGRMVQRQVQSEPIL